MLAKGDALTSTSKQVEQFLKTAEACIDKQLADFTGERIVINGDLLLQNVPYALRAKFIQRIKEKYGDGGWEVEYSTDQRDGDYFQFS